MARRQVNRSGLIGRHQGGPELNRAVEVEGRPIVARSNVWWRARPCRSDLLLGLLDGVERGLGAALQSELGEQVVDMGLDRAFADCQCSGNVTVRAAFAK